jgi:hypothetical protein
MVCLLLGARRLLPLYCPQSDHQSFVCRRALKLHMVILQTVVVGVRYC